MAGSKDSGESRSRKDHYRCAALLHPLRHRILRLMLTGRERGVSEIAVELDEAPGPIAYHLRVLVRLGALKARARSRPAPALFRWSPEARWARKMLDEIDEQGSESG